MISQMRQLAQPAFYPCTQRFDVSGCIPGSDVVTLDLEPEAPLLIHENREQARLDGTGRTIATATTAELQLILQWLTDHRPHPETLTPLEVKARFNATEQALILQHSSEFAYRLFSAIEPIAWATFETSVQQLAAAGVSLNVPAILSGEAH